MERVAFLLGIKPGNEAEYKRRHDEIWPEMVEALTQAGAEVLHPPKLWPQYHADFYATFFLDPDGFRLEVAASRDARL